MFKIHSLQNKESIAAIGIVLGLFLLLIIDVIVIVPAVASVYFVKQPTSMKTLIDTQAVNDAIKYLVP